MFPPSTKIALENFIFQLAAAQNTQLLSKRGYLLAVCPSDYLRQLLNLYNYFYVEENKFFVKTDLLQQIDEEKRFRFQYLQQRKKYPLRPAFHLSAFKTN